MESNGAERIAAERRRQIEDEGWTTENDDSHTGEQLAIAAACIAAPEPIYVIRICGRVFRFEYPFPWAPSCDPQLTKGRIRQLEIAGALIAAEIDRLLRAGSPS